MDQQQAHNIIIYFGRQHTVSHALCVCMCMGVCESAAYTTRGIAQNAKRKPVTGVVVSNIVTFS